MNHLNDGQRAWLTTHVAEVMRTRGLPVTPSTLEAEIKRLASNDLRQSGLNPYAIALLSRLQGEPTVDRPAPIERTPPPDPYSIGLARLREGEPTVAPLPLDKSGIPDPYFEGLRKLREEERLRKQENLPMTPPAPMPVDKNGIPNPYFEGIKKLREENRRS